MGDRRGVVIGIKVEHTTCTAHAIYGHEGECQYLHGHNYRFIAHIASGTLDGLGRVVDFSVAKEHIKTDLDRLFDHKTILYKEDAWYSQLKREPHIVGVDFNPTVENIAAYAIAELNQRNCSYRVVKLEVYETEKCSAVAQWV